MTSYKASWEQAASTLEGAIAAVDGSADEETLTVTGKVAARRIAAALLLDKCDRVLELGCGVARIGREIAPLCARWYGVDISENMIRVARERTRHLTNVELHLLTRTHLEFPADFFDKAYALALFIHLDKEDVFLYLCELARILRPGGLLYFDAWNLAHDIGWKRWMMEVDSWAASPQSAPKDVARNQFCVPEEMQLYVRRAGLCELLCLDDSPWLQVVAGKPGPGAELVTAREQLRENLDEIVMTPLWNAFFESLLDVLCGRRSPGEFWQELCTHAQEPEAAPYRQYFRALWRKRQGEWGPLPPGG